MARREKKTVHKVVMTEALIVNVKPRALDN